MAYRLPPEQLRPYSVVDLERELSFSFDAREYQGYVGDSLASALLANGVRLFGRSFKYHRARGLLSSGVEEPNALMRVGSGNRADPNLRAPLVELYSGLQARSQHCYPSLRFDLGAVNQVLSPLIGAGFYYKTFMGPWRNTKFWMRCEHWIRKAAGLGRGSGLPDPDSYQQQSYHCDLLVIGGGRSGLEAAEQAARAGKRVLLVEQSPFLGGRLRAESDSDPELEQRCQQLNSIETLDIKTRTQAFGYYDHNLVAMSESLSDHLEPDAASTTRERLWWVWAQEVVLATGAIEQPLPFAQNDLPGVMLAGAVRAYLNCYGVVAGEQTLLYTHSDEAYRTAFDLARVGARVVAVVDPRAPEAIAPELRAQLEQLGVPLRCRHRVLRARGGNEGLRSARIVDLDNNKESDLDCDLLAVSAGWQPCLHLYSQSGGSLRYDQALHCLLADANKQGVRVVGSAAGGMRCPERVVPSLPTIEAKWTFLDYQHDVTTQDLITALAEGYSAPEHLKRYTTLGMATDQGKTANLAALEMIAEHSGQDLSSLGHTTYRPPYAPVSVGVLAGAQVGSHFRPLRRTSLDAWHADHGAEFINLGLWRRPRYYQNDEVKDALTALHQETKNTRARVGVSDVSTLGKLDIQGPDSLKFIERVYSNNMASLAVGQVRYGLMLREDGLVFDDGTCARLDEQRYLLTTTSVNAPEVLSRLEFYWQRDCPNYQLAINDVTDQWATIAVAGPNSRELLRRLWPQGLSAAELPFMRWRSLTWQGERVLIFRVSFSGELGYELHIAADYGQALWELLLEAGADLGVAPYGLEALDNMRIEKGHPAGGELTGRSSASDLNMYRLLSAKKNYVGQAMAERPALQEAERGQLVGLRALEGERLLAGGSQLIVAHSEIPVQAPVSSLGFVSSVGYSPELGSAIALGFMTGGLQRWFGEHVLAANPAESDYRMCEVVSPHFVDPEGERLRS